MDEEEKKKLLAGFQTRNNDDDESDVDWTEEELLEHAKKIIRRLGINGELQ